MSTSKGNPSDEHRGFRSIASGDTDRRAFLGGLVSGLGVVVLGQGSALGQSLLVRPIEMGSGTPAKTITETLSACSTMSWSSSEGPTVSIAGNGYPRPRAGSETITFVYGTYIAYSSHTFTNTVFGRQTLTAVDTWAASYTPTWVCTEVHSWIDDQNYVGTKYNPTSSPLFWTLQGTLTRTASYTTTAWSEFVSGSPSPDAAPHDDVSPESVLLSLDPGDDVLDARARHGAPLHLRLGR